MSISSGVVSKTGITRWIGATMPCGSVVRKAYSSCSAEFSRAILLPCQDVRMPAKKKSGFSSLRANQAPEFSVLKPPRPGLARQSSWPESGTCFPTQATAANAARPCCGCLWRRSHRPCRSMPWAGRACPSERAQVYARSATRTIAAYRFGYAMMEGSLKPASSRRSRGRSENRQMASS